MKKVKFVYKGVGEPPKLLEIEDDYKEIQKLVGGYFEGHTVSQFVENDILRLSLRNVVLYCNETGKLDGLPLNCFIGPELLVGNIAFFAVGDEGEHVDITELQVKDLLRVLGGAL